MPLRALIPALSASVLLALAPSALAQLDPPLQAAAPTTDAATPEGGVVGEDTGGAPAGDPEDLERGDPPGAGERSGRGTPRGRGRRPTLTSFSVAPRTFFIFGRRAQVRFAFDGSLPVTLTLEVRRASDRSLLRRVQLGPRDPGRTHRVLLSGLEEGVLPQGALELRLRGRDSRGRALRRSASAAQAQPVGFYWHRHPLIGPFDYGGEGARFGAERPGHSHQGQDLVAAEGIPVVAPRGGTVEVVGYQAGGAGHYVVLDGEGEDRDYAFMHLRDGSIRVTEGQRVPTGRRLGEVGSTGGSTGPHLHFEIWVGGGWYSGGRPIDPLPLLRRWDGWS